MASWGAWVLCSIPYHHSAVCAHGCYYVRVLWLVPGLVDLAFVVDLLHNVELYFHCRRLLARPSSMATNLFSVFIIVCSVWRHRFGQLYLGDL